MLLIIIILIELNPQRLYPVDLRMPSIEFNPQRLYPVDLRMPSVDRNRRKLASPPTSRYW
jgi:hypothetical protein